MCPVSCICERMYECVWDPASLSFIKTLTRVYCGLLSHMIFTVEAEDVSVSVRAPLRRYFTHFCYQFPTVMHSWCLTFFLLLSFALIPWELNYGVSPIQWEVSEKWQQLSLGSRVGVLLKVTFTGGCFPSVELVTGFIMTDGVTILKATLIPDGWKIWRGTFQSNL